MKFSTFLPLLLITTSALASRPPEIEAIAVPVTSGGKRLSAAMIVREARAIRTQQAGRSTQVFSDFERDSLKQFGDSSLGQSLKLRFRSTQELRAFELWSRVHAPHFRIENNPVPYVTESALQPLQWGLKNPGGTYSVEVDDFTTKTLPALAGEDIDLDGVASPTKQVLVAVLDSGIDVDHPDLKSAIVRNEKECTALSQYLLCVAKQGESKCADLVIDHDGNGYPLDCNGWNLASEDDGEGMSRPGPLPQTAGILGNTHIADYIGHGTHVAGIIAANTTSNGIMGVAPQAKILPVRVISGEPNETIRAQELSGELPSPQESGLKAGSGLGDIVARGILYAVRSGAQVINMSLGWPDPMDSELVRRMINIARSRKVLLVAAAGNDSTEHVIYPCRYDGVICVGAHTPDGALAFFSNYGSAVDVLAPGWNILSTFPLGLLPLHFTDQSGYESKDGTSMAAPFVSGMLARMLGAGMSPDEAYSRLILGARTTKPSQVEDPARFSNSSLSGNADLAHSFHEVPQALILPVSKDNIRIEWDRSSTIVSMRFSLENHWIDARNVRVTLAGNPSSNSVRLSRKAWAISAWKSEEQKEFSLKLKLPDDRVASIMDFRIRVTSADSSPREFPIRAELVSPIGVDSKTGPDLKSLPLLDSTGAPVSRDYSEVLTVFGADTREYLGIREAATGQGSAGRTLELLTEENSGAGSSQMKIRGSFSLPTDGSEVRALHKIHEPRTGETSYVLIRALPAETPGQVGSTELSWFDSTFRVRADHPAEKLDIAVTYFSEDFQWQAHSGELVPTWYSLGRVPPSEQKAYDPWDPTAGNTPEFRIFWLANDGVHSIELPKEYPTMVSLVEQSPEQRQAGAVSAILAKGDDYALEYATAELVEGAWRNIVPVTLPEYHNLRGIIASPVLSLVPQSPFAGTAFPGYVDTDTGPKGSRRTTVIGPSGVVDFSASPIRHFDAVTDITGTYLGRRIRGQFSLTKYEIQYHDFSEGNAALISQNRFSFMPSILALKSFFPLLAEDRNIQHSLGEARTPGLFVPGDFIFSKAAQVILPNYDTSSHLVGLIRPAKFHLESKPGCTALPKAKPSDLNGPAELVFFCGDRFLSAPIRY